MTFNDFQIHYIDSVTFNDFLMTFNDFSMTLNQIPMTKYFVKSSCIHEYNLKGLK